MKPDIILDQFVQDVRVITYMTKFFDDYDESSLPAIPHTVAKFNCYVKDNRNKMQKLFDFGERKRWYSRHTIASQINKRYANKI